MAASLNPDLGVRAATRADVRPSSKDDSVLEFDDCTYAFAGLAPGVLHAVVAECDGSKTVGEVAAACGLPDSVVSAVTQHLISLGLAVDVRCSADVTVSPARFASACRHLYVPWKQRLFSHPLWTGLASGCAPSSQFFGWLLESYHFIEGVHDRLALAVAECPDSPVREVFARHYREEYDHSSFFLEALRALGYTREAVTASRPLPGTLAALNFARQRARRDPLQYAVCSGFLESTGTDRHNAHSFLEQVKQHYAEDTPLAIDPVIAHVELDEDYGHGTLLELVCERLGPVPLARASAAIDAGARFVETLELWSTDIVRSHAAPPSLRDVRTYRSAPDALPAAVG